MSIFGFIRCRSCRKIRQQSWRDNRHCEPCVLALAFDLWVESLNREMEIRAKMFTMRTAYELRRAELEVRALKQKQAVEELKLRRDAFDDKARELFAIVLRSPLDDAAWR